MSQMQKCTNKSGKKWLLKALQCFQNKKLISHSIHRKANGTISISHLLWGLPTLTKITVNIFPLRIILHSDSVSHSEKTSKWLPPSMAPHSILYFVIKGFSFEYFTLENGCFMATFTFLWPPAAPWIQECVLILLNTLPLTLTVKGLWQCWWGRGDCKFLVMIKNAFKGIFSLFFFLSQLGAKLLSFSSPLDAQVPLYYMRCPPNRWRGIPLLIHSLSFLFLFVESKRHKGKIQACFSTSSSCSQAKAKTSWIARCVWAHTMWLWLTFNRT